MELDRLLLIAATAGIWMLVLGDLFGDRPSAQGPTPEAVAQGVKQALNDCGVRNTGKFACKE